MLIRISGRAEITVDGEPLPEDSIIRELHGVESDDTCDNYLDIDLAELGITGGTVKITYDSTATQFRVTTEYTAPDKLNPTDLERLVDNTVGQWSDGIGEGCFDDLAVRLGVEIDLFPFAQDRDLRVEQWDDGKALSQPKTGLAKAAREGDMVALREHLDAGADLEARLQGYTPLHLAVLYGHVEAALELINRGADIKALDPQDQDSLLLTAMSNSMTDPGAAQVARALLERGVSVYGHGEYTPLYMAENRKKTQLGAVLREYGASK
ncbi:MAG: ankyrin repeat domain-containing protein [Fimbriiglobus sp.]